MASRVITKDLTRLDLIKGLSMFVMITDHVGYYFFPTNLWFRAFGRIDFPVWFFLPGYSKSRAFEWSWIIGGLILQVGNILAGLSLMPVNAIFTIMLIRFTVDRLAGYMLSREVRLATVYKLLALLGAVTLASYGLLSMHLPEGLEHVAETAAFAIDGAALCWFLSYAAGPLRFWLSALALAVSFPVTYIFFEYGALGLIIGVFGWLCRNRDARPEGQSLARNFGLFCWLAFSVLQQYMFRFDVPQFLLMSLGTGMYLAILYFYRPEDYPAAQKPAWKLPAPIVRFMGRHTLELYVFHLLLFKAVKLWYHPELFMKWGAFVGAATKAPI
jgi:hypothetical protein